jgi:hypothetical protein
VVDIPGRRVSHGDSFFSDWFSRGGDSMIVRAETIIDSGLDVDIEVETRKEPGTAASTLTPTYVSNGTGTKLRLNDPGVFTGLWRASTTGGAVDSLQGQVRLKVSTNGGVANNYQVIRVFPPVFFDNAKP